MWVDSILLPGVADARMLIRMLAWQFQCGTILRKETQIALSCHIFFASPGQLVSFGRFYAQSCRTCKLRTASSSLFLAREFS